MRLPPRSRARVAWEPTIEDASASAVTRSRTTGWAAISAWVTSAPSRRLRSEAVAPRSPSSRWIETRLSGSGACPAAPRRRGRSPLPPGARLPRARRAPRRRWPPKRTLTSFALSRRPDPLGRHRQLLTRPSIAWAIAFAIAPGVGTVGGSPTPFVPFGPPFCAGVSIQATSMRGVSEAVTSL